MDPWVFGILTVSDTCSKNVELDVSGTKLAETIKTEFPNATIVREIVPDESEVITAILEIWVKLKFQVILTTGGTGFSPRDITPEATKAIIQREAPGITHAMTAGSLKITPMGMLSRAVSGIRDKTLIVNLPGSAKASVECFNCIKSVLSHAVSLLTDNTVDVREQHKEIQQKRNLPNMSPSKVKINIAAARHRTSPYPLVEVTTAKIIVLKECHPTEETEDVSVESALHRVLAEDVFNDRPHPPFRASIKDGYAVKSGGGCGVYVVKDVIAAGGEPQSSGLRTDEAIRISTGAPVPDDADAVVQVEDTTLVEASEDGTQELKIKINVAPKKNQDIRKIGSDISANSKVMEQFEVLTGAHLGVLVTIGKTTVKVYRRRKIAVISTGNELKSLGDKLQGGQIYDSNRLTLLSLFKEHTYEARDYGIARDEPNHVKATLVEAFKENDIVVTTGGVSMGEFDIMKQVLLEDFDASIHFGRINMKPGKPTTFATLEYDGHRKYFFGLPGNPVSACVTSLLFIIPALKFMERRKSYDFPIAKAYVDSIKNNDVRPSYIRAYIKIGSSGKLIGFPTGDQISSRLNSLIGANGLILIPPGEEGPGEFQTILFGNLMN